MSETKTTTGEKSLRGFAAMSPEMQRELASKGGKAAHARGTANKFTSETAREAGRKGGEAVARNVERMRELGKAGGKKTSEDRARMSENGRKGGLARRRKGEVAPSR